MGKISNMHEPDVIDVKQKRGNRIKMYEITVHEKKYINQDDALVTVFFQLPYHDWKLLETSTAWNQVEKLLQEIRNKHNQKCHREQAAG